MKFNYNPNSNLGDSIVYISDDVLHMVLLRVSIPWILIGTLSPLLLAYVVHVLGFHLLSVAVALLAIPAYLFFVNGTYINMTRDGVIAYRIRRAVKTPISQVPLARIDEKTVKSWCPTRNPAPILEALLTYRARLLRGASLSEIQGDDD